MGQKVNPIVFRLESKNSWESKYIEKKLPELSYYVLNDLEIKKFVIKFFKDNGMILNKLIVNHSNNSLHLFISYYLSFQSSFYRDIKNQKINKNRIKSLNDNLITNVFLEKFLNTFKLFNKAKNQIYITLEQVNSTKKILFKNKIKNIKKSLVQLRKYKQYEFFKEGINTIFSTLRSKNGSELLANFISIQLKKFKRHNFFLRFIKTGLRLFINQKISTLKSLKIKIKGRLNGRPRAKHRIIQIKNGVPVLTIKSNIDYFQSTAFTTNGTIGVKVWIEK